MNPTALSGVAGLIGALALGILVVGLDWPAAGKRIPPVIVQLVLLMVVACVALRILQLVFL